MNIRLENGIKFKCLIRIARILMLIEYAELVGFEFLSILEACCATGIIFVSRWFLVKTWVQD